MKVAVIGANGQLGSDVCQVLAESGFELLPLVLEQLDVTEEAAVREWFRSARPEAVINTAAFHHVEKCESDPQTAFRVNAVACRHLSRGANDASARLVHISTDYVFDGRVARPYRENDLPLPVNVYGNSKLAGEYFVRSMAERHWVVRVSGIFGRSPCIGKGGLNFVETMLKLAREKPEVRVVDDEFLTPTATLEVARQLARMLAAGAPDGLYHATAQGSCSWYEFAAEIFRLAGVKTPLHRAAPGEFPIVVRRPKYSVLENSRLQELGLDGMAPWQDGLREYLRLSDRLA